MQITLHCGGGLDSVINTDQDEYTVNYRSAPNWDEYTVNYRSAPNWDEYSLYCGSATDQDELTLYEV